MMARELIHGTCVALGERAALLRGEPGSGKSDLALRFLALPAEDTPQRLVADDQVYVDGQDGVVTASAPETLAGMIEVRGLGIMEAASLAKARLVLVCDLVRADQVPRMAPEPWDTVRLAGVELASLKIAPFEASAPLKLRLALLHAP
jgi:HPr kinase/phosphorylase